MLSSSKFFAHPRSPPTLNVFWTPDDGPVIGRARDASLRKENILS